MNRLIFEQFLPISVENAWDFFATPTNLNKITPEEMAFKVTSELPEKMYEGLIITYKITPVLNIPLTWVTEITEIKEPLYFIDEQRKGPYKTWHHEHHFKKVDGGVIMKDILDYEVGKSIFGWVAEKLFVNKKVQKIFSFREQMLKKLFLADGPPPSNNLNIVDKPLA